MISAYFFSDRALKLYAESHAVSMDGTIAGQAAVPAGAGTC